MALSAQIDEFIRLVEAYLDAWQFCWLAEQEMSHAVTRQKVPGGAYLLSEDDQNRAIEKYNQKHGAMMDAGRAMQTQGRIVAGELAKSGRDPADVLNIVNSMDRGGGGAKRANGEWQPIKSRLQAAALMGRPKAKATRRRKAEVKPRPLTAKQTEAVQIVGECKGNIAEAARRVDIDRKAMQERYDAAMKKLGKTELQHRTIVAREDRRGQTAIAEGDDRRR